MDDEKFDCVTHLDNKNAVPVKNSENYVSVSPLCLFFEDVEGNSQILSTFSHMNSVYSQTYTTGILKIIILSRVRDVFFLHEIITLTSLKSSYGQVLEFVTYAALVHISL